jgi:hypothetical protein
VILSTLNVVVSTYSCQQAEKDAGDEGRMDLLALCTMYLGKLENHKSQLVDEADFHQKESAAEPGTPGGECTVY